MSRQGRLASAGERPRPEAQPSARPAVGQARPCTARSLVAVRAEAAGGAGTAPARPPPPSPPAHAAAQAPAAAAASLATASELLSAIHRCGSVAELRGALQRGQAAGCLTNAHCIALLARLVALAQAQAQTPAVAGGPAAAGAASPSAAPRSRVPKEARQLGQELWRRLQPHRATLSPALQAVLDQAQAALQLGEQNRRPQVQAEAKAQAAGPRQEQAPRPQAPRQQQGQQQGQEAGQSRGKKPQVRAQPAPPAQEAHAGLEVANGSVARGPLRPAPAPAAAASHLQSEAQAEGQKRPKQQRQQQQERQQQAPGAGPAAATASTQHADVPAATTSAAAVAPAAMAATSPLQAPTAANRVDAAAAGDAAGASAPPAADGTAALAAALQLGWQALQKQQQEPPPAASSGDAGVASSSGSGSVDLTALEAVLQTQPAASMALSDIAEVLQLLGALRLMPRHVWLCGARDTLRAAVADAQAQLVAARAAGQQEGAGVREAVEAGEALLRQNDLRALLEAVEELMVMCWEADAGGHTPPPASAESGSGSGRGSGNEQAQSQAQAPAAAAVVAAAEASSPDAPGPVPSAADSPVTSARTSSAPAGGALEAAAHEPAAAQPQPQEDPLWEEPAPEEPLAALRRLQALMQAAQRAAGGAAGPVLTGCLADDGGDAAAALDDLQQLLEREAAAALLLPAQPQPQRLEQVEQATQQQGARVPVLAPLRLACMLDAARALQPQLPAALLAPAARLMVASLVRGGGGEAGTTGAGAGAGSAQEHLAALLSACAAARYVPPAHLLDKLASLAFPAQPHQHQQQPQRQGAYVRALHECGEGLSRLGHRLNAQRFSSWADVAAAAPRQLSGRQLLQFMAACLDRRTLIRADAAVAGGATASGAAAILAAVLEVPSRLAQLSAAETAATVAAFAAQQGVRLSADGATALVRHLTPRLTQLQPGQLAVLLPALGAAGALGAAAPDAAAAESFLAAHSAALQPSAELLQPASELLPLLRAYADLQYRPPPLLLLGLALGLEGSLVSSPLPAALSALHLLLCRLRMPPNEGLATAVRDALLPRLMVAATAPAAPLAPQQGAAPSSAAPPPSTSASAAATAASPGLTTAQKLEALDVLVAARVRPHPAQLAALLDVGMTLPAAGSGSGSSSRLAGLTGRQLTRLLWLCVAFRALPSWRFMGEWLQAAAEVLRQAVDATPAPPSHTTTSATASSGDGDGDSANNSSGGGGGGEGAGGVSPRCLVRMGWCLSQMGLRPEPAWQAEYHAALLPALPALDLEALSLAATSVLALRSRPGAEWLEAWMRAALGRLEAPGVAAAELDGASAARLLHFAAAAEAPVTRDWMQSFFLHTLHLVEASPAASTPAPTTSAAAGAGAGAAGRRAAFTADQLALTLRGLAALGYRPPQPWLEAALEALRRAAAVAVATAETSSSPSDADGGGRSSSGSSSSSSLSPACYPVALSALGRLAPDVAAELGPGSVVEALVRAAHEQRERFGELELTWLLETLEQSYSGYRLPPAAAANLAAALRRRQAGDAGESEAGGRGEGSGQGGEGDVAGSLADAVSAVWLAW
ncbi:hypothetical protein HXX76_004551 [Chlamydomonas incerta]|uniref:Uncharacterized protein n=1 Tax=Chlamydomonas incerta TaxID=51695 RepID=A0A835T8U4_CHLIN|nr:hypothetical protein HXX76_004551 [Chlamydomonas incerta]|eukprot:KAG2439187.1 hypothetical protein HXX76_004551 [Chlamydomonas incerta]